jgi:hypothetical protein
MAVQITSRKIYDKLRPASGVDWSLFAIGDRLNIEIEFTVFTRISFTVNSPMNMGSPNSLDPNILRSTGNRFASVNVGDTIKIVDPTPFPSNTTWSDYLDDNYTFTVLFKTNSNEIIVSNSIENDLPLDYNANVTSTAIIYNLTAITGVGLPYNFVENNEPVNFTSKVDNSFQRLIADGLDASNTTPIDMQFDGPLPYQIGSATIEGVSWDTDFGEQKFKIIHETVVTPLFLANQYFDLVANIAPSYFFGGRCLRHVYQIQAFAVLSNPNSAQIIDCPSEIGNSGWFNEVFNGGQKGVVAFLTTEQESQLLLLNTDEQIFNFTIKKNPVNFYGFGSEFSSDTKFIVNAFKLPNQQSEYQNNSRKFEDNFLFTETLLQANDVPVSPITTGTSKQTITEIKTVDAISYFPNEFPVRIKFQFTNETLAILNESQNQRFIVTFTISNNEIENTPECNKQNIIAKIFQFDNSVNQTPALNVKFIRHYEDATDVGIESGITTFLEDECVMITDFYPTTVDGITDTFVNEIRQQIIAKKTDGTEFVLEDLFWTTASPIGFGISQQINFESPRVFQIPETEPRKTFSITTSGSPESIFRINYPFMIRWEYWIQLLGVNSEFYNPSLPNNGLNQLWLNYQTGDWAVYHRTIIRQVSQSGAVVFNDFVSDLEIEINDYESNPAYTTKDVETYSEDGSVAYFDAGNSRWYYSLTERTLVRAIFEKATSFDLPNTYVVFGIEIFENGGIGGRRRFSSVWETDTPLTWFVPLNGANTVKLTNDVATEIIAEAFLDPQQIPNGEFVFKIVARIYEADLTETNKITEAGVDKITEAAVIKIIE